VVSTTGRHHWPGLLATRYKHIYDDDDADYVDEDDMTMITMMMMPMMIMMMTMTMMMMMMMMVMVMVMAMMNWQVVGMMNSKCIRTCVCMSVHAGQLTCQVGQRTDRVLRVC
jgi:hypothetical protein